MDDFRYYTPTEVIFGRNAEQHIGEVAAQYGKRALLVYGQGSAEKSGLLERIEESLRKYGIEFQRFPGAQPNPTLAHAREGVAAALAIHAELIIGIGGGSSIDTAKAIAHGAANSDNDLWDLWTRKVPLTRSLPVGAVLTIPAAGSEMSDSAVLTNEEIHKKAGINTDYNRCRFAIMNPELGMSLPAWQIAAGTADIMMHTMERYFIPKSDCDMTDEIAEGLLRCVIRNGAAAVKDPENYHAMSELFWASSLSHNQLTECGRGKDFSVHKLGHALSARYGVTHGASLTAVWGAWARLLYKDALPRFTQFARNVWGIRETNGDNAAAAEKGIAKTEEFFRSIGMPTNLTELGISPSDEELREMSLDATMGDTVKLSRIRPLDAAAVETIYQEARMKARS